jgi:hypothetical protein
MPLESDRIMFEIYREGGFNRRYRVVYFTELDEHNKEHEINAALAGEHVHDGYLAGSRVAEAKRRIHELLGRLNGGEPLAPGLFRSALEPYTPAESG